jgi:hypothetical protein
MYKFRIGDTVFLEKSLAVPGGATRACASINRPFLTDCRVCHGILADLG